MFEAIKNKINQVKQYPAANEYNKAVTQDLEISLRSVDKLASSLADLFENADVGAFNPEKQIGKLCFHWLWARFMKNLFQK